MQNANGSELDFLLQIPDDEDPEYYYQNMIQNYQKIICSNVNEIKKQKETIQNLYNHNNENKIKDKFDKLIENINNTNQETNLIHSKQRELMETINDFYQQTSKTNRINYTLEYVNYELDKLIKKYKEQRKQNISTIEELKKLYEKIPMKNPVILQKHDPEIKSIQIETH